MSILEKYIGQYVQLTIDPKALTEGQNRNGTFCYVGKLVEVDSHFALLSPFDVYRPDDQFSSASLRDVVEFIRGQEAETSSKVANLDGRLQEIRTRVGSAITNSRSERPVSLNSILNVDVYREA